MFPGSLAAEKGEPVQPGQTLNNKRFILLPLGAKTCEVPEQREGRSFVPAANTMFAHFPGLKVKMFFSQNHPGQASGFLSLLFPQHFDDLAYENSRLRRIVVSSRTIPACSK